jgi:glycerol-3-phosphate dehydrogenase
LEFIIPCRKLTEKYFYGTGLKLYDFLAASSEMPSSHGVSKAELYQKIPNLRKDHFAGGVAYSDGQFDDARLLIEIVRAAVEAGAIAINYAPVEDLLRNGDGKINGLRFCDRETGRNFEVRARCVVNATGPFCDSIRKLDNRQTTNLVAASQGVHLVLPKRFYSSSTAVIVPKTSDGRVLFIIPWHDFVVVGTTDTPIQEVPEEPRPFPDELAFLLRTMADYLEKPPTLEECTSVFTGVRPLVKASSTTETKRLSRDHTIELSPSGLMTITGGKWTTYRHMAEDCVDRIAAFAKLPSSNCSTKKRSLNMTAMDRELFQADASDTQTALERLHPELAITRRDLLYSIRFEFARTVEDLLARRTRALFIHSRAAVELAPTAANLLAQELGQDDAWVAAQIAEFNALARSYSPTNSF